MSRASRWPAGSSVWALALALAVALTLGGGPMAHAADYGAANAHIADHHIIPRYAELAAAAAALESAMGELCGLPGAATLEAARRAFHDTMDGWMAVEHVRIGPMESGLSRQRLYFWPDFRGRGARQLSRLLAGGDEARIVDGRLAADSVAVQGLPALEQLLFDAAPADFGTAAAATFRCRLAAAIATNVAGITRAVHDGWTTGDPAFREVFVAPATVETHFLEPRQTTGELFQGLYESLKVVEQLKLRKPMGDDAKDADIRRFESWRSGRTGRNLAFNLAAMEALYTGGLARLLEDDAVGRALDERMGNAFAAARTAIDLLVGRLPEAARTPEGHVELELAATYVAVLIQLTGGELAPAIGLTTGFNSLDGD